MNDRPVREHVFSWGAVWTQTPDLVEERGALAFACGRPSAGHGSREELLRRGLAGDGWKEDYPGLSGAFVLVACDERGLTVVTDPMGVVPVYEASGTADHVVGSMPELVARLAKIPHDFDPVSLAEILVRRAPTFPFTTRRSMRELAPGSSFRMEPATPASVRATSLWRPAEGAFDSAQPLSVELRSAVQRASECVAWETDETSVLLSGGKDSRVVQAVIPEPKRGLAVTFAGPDDNQELQVARRVAAAEGVRHRVLRRSDDFYAEPMLREHRLLGAERAAGHAHGLVLLDDPPRPGNVLVGGYLSDTLLRGFSPRRGGFDDWKPDENELSALRKAVRNDVLERSRARSEQLAEWRPKTAGSWSWFYPVSRQRAASHLHVLQRLAQVDELFLHRPIIELAAGSSREWTWSQEVIDEVFASLAPRTAGLALANTGAPLDAPAWRTAVGRQWMKLRRTGRRRARWSTEGSWPSWRQFVVGAPAWRQLRERAARSESAGEVLNPLLERPVRALLADAVSRHGFRFEMGLVFLILHLEETLAGRPPATHVPGSSGREP